jgi:hypothetical protein
MTLPANFLSLPPPGYAAQSQPQNPAQNGFIMMVSSPGYKPIRRLFIKQTDLFPHFIQQAYELAAGIECHHRTFGFAFPKRNRLRYCIWHLGHRAFYY